MLKTKGEKEYTIYQFYILFYVFASTCVLLILSLKKFHLLGKKLPILTFDDSKTVTLLLSFF